MSTCRLSSLQFVFQPAEHDCAAREQACSRAVNSTNDICGLIVVDHAAAFVVTVFKSFEVQEDRCQRYLLFPDRIAVLLHQSVVLLHLMVH